VRADALARSARALRALGRFRESNAAYRAASAAAPGDAAINTAWGELFLEKYNRPEALKSFQAALERDPRWTPALLGAARTLADENPPQAIAMAKRALEVNPSSVDAQVFLASQAIDADHRDEARQSLEKALAVNPSSLEAHAWMAALNYVEDKEKDFEAEVAKALAVSPSYGEVYRVAGEVAARNYRFDEAVVLARRALTLTPKDPHVLADLGIHLLRTGDEPAARTALDTSWAIDPFDVVTFNLLGLMDTLDKFETVRDGDLVFRMSKDEASVLKDQAVAIAHQALTTMAARYEFTPRGPILIEIFPRHDDFAVRNVGLPGMIGALGACFGRVVTMDSPRARPPGSFQWEATLWHELAHVITIQMSNQRVPRWLTEGISVYEEKRARPEWGREADVDFAQRLNRGETLKLRDLNEAFQNPKTISLAYFQASLLVDQLVTTFGEAGLRKLLRTYALGLDTDAALKTALNTDFDQLQVGFDQSVERTFGSMRRAFAGEGDQKLAAMALPELKSYTAEHAGSYPAQMALGRALRKNAEPDEAMRAFERAAVLVPVATGLNSPHAQMAQIALEKKDRARAITELQAFIESDFNSVDAARELASLLKQSGVDDPAKLGPVYQRIVAIDPFDGEAHTTLGRFAMQRNQPEIAAREFRAVLALAPVDRAAAHTDLAESYFKSGKRDDAKKQTIAALEIAPTYERAQDLLLKLTEGRP
jgi:tetratricopeptide (TPR) repeat protein